MKKLIIVVLVMVMLVGVSYADPCEEQRDQRIGQWVKERAEEGKQRSFQSWLQQKYSKVKLGLKQDQVIRLIGEPCEVRRTISQSGEFDYWTYGFGPTLLFKNGVLVVIQY